MSIIDEKYRELGGAGGFLGRPTGPERETPDGQGRYRHFEVGSIYATLETGAHEAHGNILGKWDRAWLGPYALRLHEHKYTGSDSER